MFKSKSAWFSTSVSPACHNFWILEGGRITGWRTADYLFSEDATCPDTLRIYESKDYLWNKVVVFHSLFLSTCEKRQSIKSACIGHYVLPPVSVQDEVRKVVGRLIWESEDEQSVTQSSHKTEEEQSEEENKSDSEPSDADFDSESSQCANMQDYPISNRFTGYVSIDNLPKYLGDLHDYHPGCFHCSTCKGQGCSLQTKANIY